MNVVSLSLRTPLNDLSGRIAIVNKEYSIPLVEIRHEHVVVNSRFIATLAPAFSVEEARAFIARIKKEFADASHNVPAYIIGGGNTVTEFCSDDGEPAGHPASLRWLSCAAVGLVMWLWWSRVISAGHCLARVDW